MRADRAALDGAAREGGAVSVCILIGDVRERLQGVADGSIDCIIADPSYGETSLTWDRRVAGWPALVRPKLKPYGSM